MKKKLTKRFHVIFAIFLYKNLWTAEQSVKDYQVKVKVDMHLYPDPVCPNF